MLKGIAALHPATEKRAKPLQFMKLEKLAAWLDAQIAEATDAGDARSRLGHLRNRALVLLGFRRGFRSDELSRLQIEHVTVEPGRGMTLFLPRTKGDRAQSGTTFKAPALSRLCPVAACEAWIAASGLTEGAVFRSIDRWRLRDTPPMPRPRGVQPARSFPCCWRASQCVSTVRPTSLPA